MNILGNRIKRERENLGLSREELANKIGVSYSAISMYEQGNREPNTSLLIKLCEIFNCSMDYLTGKSNYRTAFEEFINIKSPLMSLKDFGNSDYMTKDEFVMLIAKLYNEIDRHKKINYLPTEDELRIIQLYNSFLNVPEARKIIDNYNNSSDNNSIYKNDIYHDNASGDQNTIDIFDAFGFDLTLYERDFILDCIPNESINYKIQYFDGDDNRKKYIIECYNKILDFIHYLQKDFSKPLKPINKLSNIDDIINYKEILRKNGISNNDIDKYYMCPVYGRIAAGEPNWAEECMEGYLPISPELMNIINPEECYFLKVNGESMNKVIKNGAFALIRKTDWVEDGEIAVVLVNGYDATLKKFKRLKKSGFIMLEPQSNYDEFEPIIIDPKETEIKIIGKYIGKMEMN